MRPILMAICAALLVIAGFAISELLAGKPRNEPIDQLQQQWDGLNQEGKLILIRESLVDIHERLNDLDDRDVDQEGRILDLKRAVFEQN